MIFPEAINIKKSLFSQVNLKFLVWIASNKIFFFYFTFFITRVLHKYSELNNKYIVLSKKLTF